MYRLPQVKTETGLGRSSIYAQIKDGLWTRPIRLGLRAVGWPADECHAIIAARVAGRNGDEIRALVRDLEKARAGTGHGGPRV